MVESIIYPAGMVAMVGLGCGILLSIASRVFAVSEDPRIGLVQDLLPGANCGACGYAGCADFAKAVVLNGEDAAKCKAMSEENLQKVAGVLGIEIKAEERRVAIVLCAGDDSLATRKSLYNGIADCADAAAVGGGDKACSYGCLGLGSCARACPVNAIEITANRLAVVHPEICIGCGKCVGVCPRSLIKLVPESRTIHVLCSSKDKGPAVKKICKVGCIGCTLCTKQVDNGQIKMEGPLAVVDYDLPIDSEAPIEKCPQKTIVNRSGKREST